MLGWLNLSCHVALVMAPFGASCVLLFSLPDSPLARPKNVLGGHLLTACVGLVIGLLPLPAEVQMALATGLAIALMQGLNILHPPAGANPLLILMTGQEPAFLWQTVLPGTLLLMVLAYGFQWLRQKWPIAA
ncbi:HPP family protein [Aeromonas veronii]|nr:HPP family protein [Aeromonas veronii]HDT6076526.1 HPP family protein [Aeromonas veronii bv. veronii]MBL0482538.1 HPP family protein [Aeromonas veronii]MBL0490134.1 HPP family protein [Aeromonas veronii]MBL0505795.1 HPP family protein [Aeromonas veronii]